MRSIEGSTYPESLYDSVSRVLIQFSRTLGDLKGDPDGESPIPASAFLGRIGDLRDRCAELLAASAKAGHPLPGQPLLASFDTTLELLTDLVSGNAASVEGGAQETMDRCRAEITNLLATLGRVRDALGETPVGFDRPTELPGTGIHLRLGLASDLKWLDCAHPERPLVPKGTLFPHTEILVDRRTGSNRGYRFSCGGVRGELGSGLKMKHQQILVALKIDWLGFMRLEAVPTDDPERHPAFAGPVALPVDFHVLR